MIHAILGDFSDRLTEAYRDVIHAGSSVVETLDAILWLLDQAGRHFSREIEILQGFKRLLDIGVADRYTWRAPPPPDRCPRTPRGSPR
jgi:hypothetical protein